MLETKTPTSFGVFFQPPATPNNVSRVHNYIKNIVYEVGTIAHSCGVRSPRELNRGHVHIVLENGTSVTLEQIYPCDSSVQ